jgi:hypothetical protein
MSFMASFQAQTEPFSGLTLRACSLLPCPACILLFTATVQVSHPALLLSGWLLTNVQVNIITMLHNTRHTCIYITLVLLFISSFYTSSIFLGRLAALYSLRPLHLQVDVVLPYTHVTTSNFKYFPHPPAIALSLPAAVITFIIHQLYLLGLEGTLD